MGVDDSVAPEDLVDISQKYPFVEWGINLCSNCARMPSYPSDEWLEELLPYTDRIRLRGVLRGRWERDMLAGNLSLKIENPKLWDALHRVQVNVSEGYKNLIDSLQLISDKEVVLETTNSQNIIGQQLNAHILLPKERLFTFPGYCGYSLMDQDVELICGHQDLFWVNVDGFRDEDGITMDLLKVEEVLDLTEDYVTNASWIKALLQTSAVQKRFSEYA